MREHPGRFGRFGVCRACEEARRRGEGICTVCEAEAEARAEARFANSGRR